jgi:hypothetical protein
LNFHAYIGRSRWGARKKKEIGLLSRFVFSTRKSFVFFSLIPPAQQRIIDGKATLPEGKSKKANAFLVRPVAFLVCSEKNRVGRDPGGPRFSPDLGPPD